LSSSCIQHFLATHPQTTSFIVNVICIYYFISFFFSANVSSQQSEGKKRKLHPQPPDFNVEPASLCMLPTINNNLETINAADITETTLHSVPSNSQTVQLKSLKERRQEIN